MKSPVPPTVFESNPFQEEWYESNFFYSRDGIKEFPRHPCKDNFEVSLPFIKHFRVALDIGCRDGEYTRYCQRHFNHTYSFDPNLSPNFRFNSDLRTVTHFRCALGDEARPIVMHGGQHWDIQHLHTKKPKVKQVPCYTLDEFEFNDVDHIKIDVEGFERKVLIGGSKTIEKYLPTIILEQNAVVLPGEKQYSAKEWLEERGYRHVASCHAGWNLVMVPNG